MDDDCITIKNCVTPTLEQGNNCGQPFKQQKKTARKPRICFIITKKKNSSWVDDLCNREMMKPKEFVIYH